MIRPFIFCQRPVWIKSGGDQPGFTLLEVVCSLTLMGLVVVASLSFLGHSLNFWERSGRWGQDEQVVRQIDRNLAKFVGRLYGGDLPCGEERGFLGDDRSVEGLIEEEDGLARAGLYWEVSERTLYIWEGSREKRVALAKDIDQFELTYYQSGHGWVSSWDNQPPLPTHIRLNWTYQKRKEPPLMQAVLAGRDIPAP